MAETKYGSAWAKKMAESDDEPKGNNRLFTCRICDVVDTYHYKALGRSVCCDCVGKLVEDAIQRRNN